MSSASAIHPGDVLAGRYRVDRVLGRGSMGIVVRALDLERGALCALKVLTPAALSHPTAVARFVREARAILTLTSPHVVRVLDVGALDDGVPYMVMEALEGADLSTVRKTRGALPAHEAARYVIDACHALAEAHARGIVHRDLKPQNLFLAHLPDGTVSVKVLDFGIAKALVALEGETDLTLTNTVLGSPSFMSPEQIRSARDVDARSDVWSLGVVLYQLVTGQLPFPASNAGDVVTLVLKATPEPPSRHRAGLPLAFDAVVLRCLEKDRAARFPSVTALAAALAPFVPARPSPPSPPAADGPEAGRDRPSEAARHRRLGLLALGAAGAVAALLAVGAALLR